MLDMTNKDMSCIKHQVLRVIDILIGCFIIAPLVVLYWRSTWKLMDLYIVPSYPEISGIICTIGGFTLSFIIVLFHQEISLRTSNCNIVLLQTIRSVLVYVTSLGCILYWRGVWLVLDHVTPRTWMSYLACHSISLLILLTTKTVSSIVSPPGVLVNDIHVNSPSITTVGFHNDEDSIGKTICNALLTVVIVGSAVVGYWRGTWLILDHITINISDLYNSLLSCSIGCGVCIICYIIAEPLQEKVPDMTSWIAIVGEHVFVYILGASTVSVWRGFWIMSDILILQGTSHLTLGEGRDGIYISIF